MILQYGSQWALPAMGWDTAYDTIPVTGSATLAVLDTGIDATHPDLAARMGAGQSFTSADPTVDVNGHGTALAGIAAADVNNGIGIARCRVFTRNHPPRPGAPGRRHRLGC